MNPPFRVLCLSGGGMRGVFSAAALAELHDALRNHTGDANARLTDYFDLIVGTSTGGLLALGLAFGKEPAELLDAYKLQGARVFPPWWRNHRLLLLGGLLCPLYSRRRLRDVVEAMVPADKVLGDAACHLVLTAVRRESGEITCLKTKHDHAFYRDHLMTAVEAGLATAAAPVFFPHIATEKHGELVDGGLWANTPILVGLVEAKRYFKQSDSSIRVLSIGTTHAKLARRRWWHRGGYAEYGGLPTGRLHEFLWEGQRRLAIEACRLILPENGLTLIDHEFSDGGYRLTDASKRATRALEHAGRSQAQRAAREVCERFFTQVKTIGAHAQKAH